MRIDVWADFICPWCYLGKRRLELALAQHPAPETLEIHWHSFELDPDFPRDFAGGVNDLLVRKYGMPRAEAESMHARLTALGAAEGLVYRFDRARPSNTRDAHRLLQAAVRRGLGAALQARFMRAYFEEGASLNDPGALASLAREAGLDAAEVENVLGSSAFATEVESDERSAHRLGYRGVPAFLFGEKVQLSGAQTPDVLLSAIQRAERANS